MQVEPPVFTGMQADLRLALELPLKIVIWEQEGVCHVEYQLLSEIIFMFGYEIGDQAEKVNAIDSSIKVLIENIFCQENKET